MKVFGMPIYHFIEEEKNAALVKKNWPVIRARLPEPERDEMRMVNLKVYVEERNRTGYMLKCHSPFGIIHIMLERSNMHESYIKIADTADVVILGGIFYIFSEIDLDIINNTIKKMELDPIEVLRYALFTGDWKSIPFFIQPGIAYKLKELGLDEVDDSLEGLIKLGEYLHEHIGEVNTKRMMIAMPEDLKPALNRGQIAGNICLKVELISKKSSFILELTYSEDSNNITGLQLYKAKGKEIYLELNNNED
jgi:hypothetical protein